MQLDTPAVRRLRDRLLATRGSSLAMPGIGRGLTPEQEAALARVGPLLEVLFLTMTADDIVSPEESSALRNAIGILTDDLLPVAIVDEYLAELKLVLETQGREARLEAIASRFALDRREAEASFALAAAIALSDGRVDDAERDLAEKLRGYFGISRERTEALLESGGSG